MAVSELNEDKQNQICDLLENLQQKEKVKNKDIRILLDKIVRKYGGKVINK
jgi:formyltetrahydrofolate hydrolase